MIDGLDFALTLIYVNRPKDIQSVALELITHLPVVNSPQIIEAIEILEQAVHPDYFLIETLRHGVLYHHGAVSESVRYYVEHLFRVCDDLKYLVANSTLIEGVNLPFDRIFLVSLKKGRRNLSRNQFRNLIGRVNRFSDGFPKTPLLALQRLQPEVHILGSDEYTPKNANLGSFVKKVALVTSKTSDDTRNELLEPVKIDGDNRDSYEDIITRLANLEGVSVDGNTYITCATAVGKKLIEHNVYEIDVLQNEKKIETRLELFRGKGLISESDLFVELIFEVFVPFFGSKKSSSKDSPLKENPKAEAFYKMLAQWRYQNEPFPKLVARFLMFWKKVPKGHLVFMGRWGDESKGKIKNPRYVKIHSKSKKERINLAIVRIREEEEFMEYAIIRFLDVLYELDFLEKSFFLQMKYGTTDGKAIELIKNGFSKPLADLLLTEYSADFTIDSSGRALFDPDIFSKMKAAKENVLDILEVERNAFFR